MTEDREDRDVLEQVVHGLLLGFADGVRRTLPLYVFLGGLLIGSVFGFLVYLLIRTCPW